MKLSTQRARYEERLHRAHRALWSASEMADALGEEQAAEVIEAAMVQLHRMTERSISGKRYTAPSSTPDRR